MLFHGHGVSDLDDEKVLKVGHITVRMPLTPLNFTLEHGKMANVIRMLLLQEKKIETRQWDITFLLGRNVASPMK